METRNQIFVEEDHQSLCSQDESSAQTSSLGEELHSKKKSFYLNHYTNFFRYIKLQFIESKFESGTSISTTLFGMIEFDIFGILSPKSYFPFFTCLPKTKHLILLPLCYIVFVS